MLVRSLSLNIKAFPRLKLVAADKAKPNSVVLSVLKEWGPVLLFYPKYRLGHHEHDLFSLSKHIIPGSKHPKNSLFIFEKGSTGEDWCLKSNSISSGWHSTTSVQVTWKRICVCCMKQYVQDQSVPHWSDRLVSKSTCCQTRLLCLILSRQQELHITMNSNLSTKIPEPTPRCWFCRSPCICYVNPKIVEFQYKNKSFWARLHPTSVRLPFKTNPLLLTSGSFKVKISVRSPRN